VARALLEEDEDAIRRTQTKLNGQSFTAAVLQKHPPTLFGPDNIENFEPGSPHWNDSVPAYPNTPNFKQWLKDERMTPKKKSTNKLGPERYKSLRVSGSSSKTSNNSQSQPTGAKSAHESSQGGNPKRGEKLGTFYDPGFNTMDKASFRTASGTCKPVPRHRGSSSRPWTIDHGAQPAKKTLPGRPATSNRHTEKKQSLYKTELCTNWTLTASCTYGNKCHFAHGIDDLKPRTRLENFKTQPCCDPAREGSRRCLYGSRCNYCHPGEAIRRPVGHTYYDRDYYKDLGKDYGDNKYPFGIYV